MLGAWRKKENWREVKRLTQIGWEYTTRFPGRAEDSGEEWRLGSEEASI